MTKYILTDFINDIRYALDKASNFKLNERSLQEQACGIYQDFLNDETRIINDRIVIPQIGDIRYDWSRNGAQILAQSYSIDYWEDDD